MWLLPLLRIPVAMQGNCSQVFWFSTATVAVSAAMTGHSTSREERPVYRP
jgi:hypothetical protein